MSTRRHFIATTAAAVGAATMLGSTSAFAEELPATDAALAVDEKTARDAIRAVNSAMRTHYAALKAKLVQELGPVVVVQNNAVGGRFRLVDKGTVLETVDPVPEAFELAKSIAHVPLGIFSTAGSHLSDRVPNVANSARIDAHDLDMVSMEGPASTAWITPLQTFRDTLRDTRRKLPSANLPADLRGSCDKILAEAIRFIDASVQARTFDIPTFQEFSKSVYPAVRVNMKHASAAQISGVGALMTRWRGELGEAAWSDLYVCVLSIWTTSELNQASIIIKQHMNQAKVATHLIDLPAVESPSDPVAVALDNLARIVQDNIAAEMVFAADLRVADALKGREDLLSQEILVQLGGGSSTGAAATAAAFGAAATKGACPIDHSLLKI
ncbi:hypothetical protein ACWENA_21030 [Streptomyces sp. NPDC004779]